MMRDNFDHRPEKTEKTDITDNASFMRAVFHSLPPGATATVTSFKGNPADATGKEWANHAPAGQLELPSDANNYFCISSHSANENGVVKRRKQYFAGLHCIMLDDIGTKIPESRISLVPSWRIETSPGNHQLGYILKEPITEATIADALMDSVIASNLCDGGAGGPTARNARLPVAINGKYDGPFQCRLIEWNPDRHFSVDDLIDGLEIEKISTGRKKERRAIGSSTGAHELDDVYVPVPTENPVIAELTRRGLYKQPLGDGRHDVTCPWVHQHTDGVDHGSCYFEPDDIHPLGGYKCLHSHGDQYRIHQLLEFLGIDPGSARMKATIKISGGELHRIVDRAEQELTKAGRHYQRGGWIVTISTDPESNESAIVPISRPALTRALSSSVQWERYDKREKSWVRCDPPERHCAVLFDAQTYEHLPPIKGIARQPYMRANGTFVTSPGYDADTCVFGVFDQRAFSLPDSPTKEDARAALGRLNEILAEFSFATDVDKAAALSLLLTAAIRLSIAHAPMYLVAAPVMGSGKSFLCKIASALASPAKPSPVSFPETEEECGKMLLALLMKSPPVVEFDDLSSDILPFDKLKTAITEEAITGRILGASKEATVSTRTLFLASGINVGPVKDMSRRVLTINIDPMCATPASRTYKNSNLLEEVRVNRGRYVSDALTIIRAWIAADRPMADVPPIASFSEWSALCRHSLIWLGLPDPAQTIFAQMATDPDAETLSRLMSGWYDQFGQAPVMVRDLISYADSTPKSDMSFVLHEIADERGNINTRRLGGWIKRHAGRFVGDMRIVPAETSRNAKVWRIAIVKNDRPSITKGEL